MGWFPSPGASLLHFSEPPSLFCHTQQIVGDSLIRKFEGTDSETAAIQTCLDTAYTVPPHPVLASGERMKLFDQQNES